MPFLGAQARCYLIGMSSPVNLLQGLVRVSIHGIKLVPWARSIWSQSMGPMVYLGSQYIGYRISKAPFGLIIHSV